MRRLARWLMNALTVLSLLLCVTAVGLWIWSHRTPRGVRKDSPNEHFAVSAVKGQFKWADIVVVQAPVTGFDAAPRPGARPTKETPPFPRVMNPQPIERVERRWPGIHWLFQLYPDTPWSTGIRWLMVTVQAWFVVAVTALAPLGWVARKTLRARRPMPCECTICRYDLTGNVSGVCPECGTPTLKVTAENSH